MGNEQINFLTEENRNGYIVSSEMKKMRYLQLKILSVIQDICEKNDIKYFAVCGTLIGAVRENGFIPWDDDIDIGMTRENANKFIEVAKRELPSDYCLVGMTLTEKFFRPHLQVRDKRTTCLTLADYKVNYCKGVWVDIFIFDKFPSNDKENTNFREKLSIYNRFLGYYTFYRTSKNLLVKIIKFIISRFFVILHGGFKKTNEYYNNYCAKFNYLQKDFYYDYLSFKPNRILKIPAHTFDNLTNHPFEFTIIKIPTNFDDALRPEYGKDYLVRKKAPSGHGNLFIDLNNSFEKYDKLSKKEFYELFK